MREKIFKLLDSINRNDLGNMYWGIDDFSQCPTDTAHHFGTVQSLPLYKKYITVYGEGEALDCGIFFEGADMSLKLRDSDTKIYFWEI